MQWLAEHANNVYFLLGFLAFGLLALSWLNRSRFCVVGGLAAAISLLVFWLVVRGVATEAMKVEASVRELAKALVAKDQEKAAEFASDELKYKKLHADKMYAWVTEHFGHYKIDDLRLRHFEVKTVSRANRQASVYFHVEAFHAGTSIFKVDCPWKMSLEQDAWKVHQVSFRNRVFTAAKDVSMDDE